MHGSLWVVGWMEKQTEAGKHWKLVQVSITSMDLYFRILRKTDISSAHEMAQCVKVPASKPDKTISIPKTRGMEGGTGSYSVSSDFLTDTTAHVCKSMHIHTQTHMKGSTKIFNIYFAP